MSIVCVIWKSGTLCTITPNLITDFFRQIRLDQNFQNVLVLQKIPKTINTLKVIALQLHRNDMLGRRETMLNKDWMTVKFEQISEKELSFMVHYCLFVDDTKVLLSVENPPSWHFFDISDSNAKCVLAYSCSNSPFGLCYLVESMDKVYMFLETNVGHLHIEVYLIM